MTEERPNHPARDALGALDEGFAGALRGLMVAAGLLLALFMVVEVVLRYVLESPFLGAEELSVLLGLWLYAIGMVYAARQNTHIAGGILTVLKLSDTVRRVAAVLSQLACVVVSGIYAYHSLMYSIETFGSTQVSSYLHWNYGIWTSSLTAGFVLMTVYFAVWAIKVWHLPLPSASQAPESLKSQAR